MNSSNSSRRGGSSAPLAAALVLALVAAPAHADTLCLKDGRVIDGPAMTRDQDAILVKFKNGDVRVPNALVEEALLASDAQDAAKGSAMAKRVEARKKYVAELKAHSEWVNRHKESSKHFDFESTLVPTVFTSYRDLMETYFTEFQKMWGIKAPKDRVPVCFYLDAEMFGQVAGVGQHSGVLGYFRFRKPLELDFFYERTDPELTQAVMFHESNHYLQKLINPDFKMPHFPGESIAEYYGASSWDPATKKLTIGLVQEGRLCEIQQDVDGDKMMSLEKMLTTDEMYEHYTWGWSLVHFLMSTDKYNKKFLHFVNTLALGKDVKRQMEGGSGGLSFVDGAEILRVFMKCLDVKDKAALGALEKEWHAYVKDKLKLVTPRGFEEAGARCASTYPPRPIKAKRLLQTAVDGGSKRASTYDKLAELIEHDEKESFDKAVGLWKKAIELDPLTAEYYAHLGRAYYDKGKKDDGKKLMQLALELDPDDPWLEFELKKLVGDKPAQPGN
jgi:hypothetical protein